MTNPLDSNNLETTISEVCSECGMTANILTCLKRYGQAPHQLSYSVSTFHKGECDFCHNVKDVTETRDFFYPDFSLIAPTVEFLKTI